nr:stage III sporulation protein AE [uncultured Blautia sp.]
MRQSAGESMKYETKMRRRYAGLGAYSKEQTGLRKGFWCILIFMLLAGRVSYFAIFQNHTVSVYAAAQTEQQEDSSIQILQEDLLDEIQIEDVQKMLDEIMDDHSFSVREALMNIINGEEPVSKETVQNFLYSLFFSDMENEKGLILKLLLVIFIAAVLAEFADVFGNGQVGNISFYIVYLALFMMLMENFSKLGSALTNWLLGLTDFMKVLSPAYFMTVAASTGASTATVFYEGVLLMVWMVQWLLANLFLPVINLSVLLKMVNHLSKEEMLTKMAELLDVAVNWGLKTLLGTVVGLQIVRNMVSPVMDAMKRSAVGKAAGAIPGIGNAVTAVTELVLTSAVMVRNSFGAVIVILLLMIGAGPIIHYGSLSLIYRFLAAIAQPISDKRVVGALSTMGEGCAMLLKILLTAEILSMLTFLIVVVSAA